MIIAILLQAAMPAMTVPQVSIGRCGRQTPLRADVVSRSPDRIRVTYRRPATVVAARLRDGTGGVAAMDVPGITYDQPLAVLDGATGVVTQHLDVVTHERPVVVVTARDAAPPAPTGGRGVARGEYAVDDGCPAR